MKTDTIAAIATAMSNAGIGIIRISGSEAFSITDAIFRSKKQGKRISNVKSHTIHYGYIYDGENLVDEVLVLVMKGPNSYTGEDTVEIDCHGGILVVKKILETVIKNGARPAEPGEFTKRAFLNGRIDLTQAEAVMDLIQSKNDYAMKCSISQLKGSISKKIKLLRENILYHIAYIESALDDPEHISLEGYGEKLRDSVIDIEGEVSLMLKSFDDGRIISEGIKTVILGKPNAGKSSLLNRLIGEDRAIVTNIAGTTRDTLEEHIMLKGISLNVIDTAGIRNTEDLVEKIGVSKAKQAADTADLIIYVVDASCPLDDNDKEIIEMIRERQALVLLNKSDLEMKITKQEIENKTGHKVIMVSVKEHTGIDEFESEVERMFVKKEINFNDEIFITNVRHKSALESALTSLNLVMESIAQGMPEDFYSIDLMNAYETMGTVIGETVEDDLVNEIFNKFCMGK